MEKMIDKIKQLYKVEDLNGEAFCRPLKTYHRFFANKIETSPGHLRKVAWVIVNIVTGIFAYTIFGLLAAIGLGFKYRDIPSVAVQNASSKALIELIRTQIKEAGGLPKSGGTAPSFGKPETLGAFKIKKDFVDDMCTTMNNSLDFHTKQYQKIYLEFSGDTNSAAGLEIKFNRYIRA